MGRVSYVEEDELDEEYVELISAYTGSADLPPELRHLMSTSERNIFKTVAHLPPVLEQFRELGGTLWAEVDISARERELVILTVAASLQSDYIWHQHVRIAQTEAISQPELQALAEQSFESFDGAEQNLVQFTNAFVHGSVDDETYNALRDNYAEETTVGLCLLASFYIMIARTTDALAVDVEEPFAGWDGENWTKET